MSGAVRLFRVDPRLVHATLMNAWVPALGARKIVVADAMAARDPRLRTILELSTMELVPIVFTAEDDLARTLERLEAAECQRGGGAGGVPVIVLFSSLESAKQALDAGTRIPELCIGHLPEGEDRKPVLPAVHLGESDLELIEALQGAGVDVYLQPLPRDPRVAPAIPPSRPRVPAAPPPAASPSPMPRAASVHPPPVCDKSGETRLSERMRVMNERGLHLRAAHALAHLAGSVSEDVHVGRRGEFVNAKSLLGLTTLGAGCGAMLDVVVSGANPKPAMDAIRALFARGFDEGVAYVEGMAEDDT